jgi:hypothetical protein
MRPIRDLSASAIIALVILSANQLVSHGEDTGRSNSSSLPIPLQGGVVKVQTGLDDLRDARLAVSRVRKAVANLYDEMTRQQITNEYSINVIGSTVINIPRPVVGPILPARPRWVHASMDEIRPIMNLFKEDTDIAIEKDRQIDASDSTKQALEPIRTQAISDVQSAYEIFKSLESLTSGESYDQPAVVDASKSLDKKMKDLDKNLKKGVAILQKEAKATKHS